MTTSLRFGLLTALGMLLTAPVFGGKPGSGGTGDRDTRPSVTITRPFGSARTASASGLK